MLLLLITDVAVMAVAAVLEELRDGLWLLLMMKGEIGDVTVVLLLFLLLLLLVAELLLLFELILEDITGDIAVGMAVCNYFIQLYSFIHKE